MSVPDGIKGLRFACECVSARRGGDSDPWAGVAKHKLLPNGTKEEILNLVAREPKTISQLAEALSLSPPSIHTHISEMVKSELLRESEEWERKHPAEGYYEPNFPVVNADERAEFEALCQLLAQRVADLFRKKRPQEASERRGVGILGGGGCRGRRSRVTRARILLKAVAGCRHEAIVQNPLGPETRAAEHA